ncbi:hypothetical protein MMC13_004264 [Lambiella insularis]|nr:hypothetical protein [Lambiella insularis]
MEPDHPSDGIDSPFSHFDMRHKLTVITSDMAHDYFDFPLGSFVPPDPTSPDFSSFEGSTSSAIDFSTPSFMAINFSASERMAANPQTVSPQDVWMENPSAPPSSAMTYMSTPGFSDYDSPHVAHSNDTSPAMYHENYDDDYESTKNFFAPLPGLDDIDESKPSVMNSIEPMGPPMSRQQSSPGQSSSRGSNSGRHSSIAGVNARKRDKPLPDIIVDDASDTIAMKRARNTAAARKSRAKKMERMEDMAATIEKLEREVERWKSIALERTGDHH